MSLERILIYGVTWCGDCRRVQRFLQQQNIPYDWINIDKDKNGEKFVIDTNNGYRSVPTIIFPDGTILVEPTTTQLAQKLGAENYS
jgi:glutaredoxin-like protein